MLWFGININKQKHNTGKELLELLFESFLSFAVFISIATLLLPLKFSFCFHLGENVRKRAWKFEDLENEVVPRL